jgi:hypothetical protein
MQFIEKLFSVSPDGGSGMIEFCLFALPLVLAAPAAWCRSTRRNDGYGGPRKG